MSFQDTLRANLTPELYNQVMDQLGDDIDLDLVPRARLNKVIRQRNELREQLQGEPQTPAAPAQTQPEPSEPNTPSVDIEALKAQWLAEQGDAVKDVRIQYAVLEKLRGANAIDPEVIWSAGLVDKSKITVDDNGMVSGVDEAIEDVLSRKPGLFAPKTPNVPAGTGKHGGAESFGSVTTKEEFLKLPTEKQMQFKQANPELFKSFLNS